MANYSYGEVLSTALIDGTAVANTTTATTLLPAQAKYVISADSWFVGRRLTVRAQGRISNVVTAAPTITVEFRLGTASPPTPVMLSTGALVCSTTAHTNVPWWLEMDLTCRAVGPTANLMGQGWMISRALVDVSGADVTTTGHPALLAPETAPAVGANFDSNVSNNVELFVTWSAASASNSIQLHQFMLIDWN